MQNEETQKGGRVYTAMAGKILPEFVLMLPDNFCKLIEETRRDLQEKLLEEVKGLEAGQTIRIIGEIKRDENSRIYFRPIITDNNANFYYEDVIYYMTQNKNSPYIGNLSFRESNDSATESK